MTTRTKDIITEIVVWTILLALSGALGLSIMRLHRWANAEVDQVEQNYLPIAEDKPAVVVSPPDQFVPQHVVGPNGENAWFGDASWYDYTFEDDGSTRVCFRKREWCYTQERRVAASRDFPRGSYLKVTNLNNGREVIVKVTDYGPEEALHPTRVIDLSSYAFEQIADLDGGLIPVKVELQ